MDGAVKGEEADLGASVARQPEAQNNKTRALPPKRAQSESTSFEMNSCELKNQPDQKSHARCHIKHSWW